MMDRSRRSRAVRFLSVVIPARDEEDSIVPTVEELETELIDHQIPHEVIIVDDGSIDRTGERLKELRERFPAVKALKNQYVAGFGKAVVYGLDQMTGDAVVIMMADGSEASQDVVRYWEVLSEGFDCVFGSRFMPGGSVTGYPRVKLLMNRAVNTALRVLFRVAMNDITNAFKAYRREVIDGCRPLVSSQFDLCVELPLTAIVRGYTWKAVPVRWHGRRAGASKLRIRAMAGRYLSTCFRIWKEARRMKKSDNRRTR